VSTWTTREILIHADPDVVFAHLTDPDRFAAWFGAGSTIDPHPGGTVTVVFPGGARAGGDVVESEPPRRMVWTWGYEGEESPLEVGASTVEFDLEPTVRGTRLHLGHSVPTAELAREHANGWRHHLSALAVLATREQRRDADAIADRWHELWDEPDPARRRRDIDAACLPTVEVVDDLVSLTGIAELAAHIAAVRHHLPDTMTERDGAPRVAADLVTWPWVMRCRETVVTTGRWVVTVDLDGRVRRAVGFWDDPPGEVARRVQAATSAP
jgi:uncharacterized protein YndB with AHSA1/START domain